MPCGRLGCCSRCPQAASLKAESCHAASKSAIVLKQSLQPMKRAGGLLLTGRERVGLDSRL